MKTMNMNLDLVTNVGGQLSAGKGKVESAGQIKGSSFSKMMDQAQSPTHYQVAPKKAETATGFTTESKKTSSEQTKTSTQTKKNEVANPVNTEQVSDSTVVGAYADELKAKLKELLGLTEEEMEDLLARMGLVTMDLLNPEQLVNVVLEQFDAASSADALTNESLSNALLESSKLLEDVVSKIKEEIVEFNSDEKNGLDSFDQILASAGEEDSIKDSKGKDESVDLDKTPEQSGEKEIMVEVHKETTDAKEGFLSKRENRGEHSDASNKGETFIDFFANKVDLSSIQADQMSVQDAKQIVTQLVDQIKLNISQTKTSMEMVLNPEALGKVQVVVQNKEGVLTAQLKVENELAKHALESSLQTLKESFENQGLKVEKVEVTIGNYSQEYAEQEGNASEQKNQGSKKKINVDDYLEDSMDTTKEATISTVTSMNGTVEYTA